MGAGIWACATFHAVALFCFGLIVIVMPHSHTSDRPAPPPVFESPAADAASDATGQFELGQTPEELSRLDSDLLAELKALPPDGAVKTCREESPELKNACRRRRTDKVAAEWCGASGPMFGNSSGPAGDGSAGNGHSTGNDFDSDGPGGVFRCRDPGCPRGTPPGERAVGAALNWRFQRPDARSALPLLGPVSHRPGLTPTGQ